MDWLTYRLVDGFLLKDLQSLIYFSPDFQAVSFNDLAGRILLSIPGFHLRPDTQLPLRRVLQP
jgi:hypothetical protein